MNQTIYEEMGGSYSVVGGYRLPNIAVNGEDLTIGPIKVSGPPTMAYRATLRLLKSQEVRYAESLARSKQLLAEIDATIGSVPDAKIRDILRRRYISGEKWETISKTYGKSREWARNTVENYFKK